MESQSPGHNLTQAPLDVSRTSQVIFLICFIVISFLFNLFIIIVIAQNVKLRSAENLLIANMCAACIIDCVFNMTITMCTLVSSDCVHVAVTCKVSSFFVNLVAIQKMLALAALTTDRYFSLRSMFRYEAWLSSCRMWSMIAYLWAHSTAFSIPFLSDALSSVFHPQLGLCMISGKTSVVLLCIKLLVCFLGPAVIIILIHLLNWRLTCKAMHKKKLKVTEKGHSEMKNEGRRQIQCSLPYTIVLFAMFIVLETPFTLISYIQQFENVEDAQSMSVIDQSWRAVATFVWARFVFSVTFPFVTFFFKKELWQCAKECVFCRRHNSIVDIHTAGIGAGMASRNEGAQKHEKEACSKTKDKDTSETPSSLTFNVPVLFATSTGICIEDNSTGQDFNCSTCTASTLDIVTLKGKTLDISYPSYEYHDDLMGDTSDYDSSCETDQYSSSQPVSVRSVLGALHSTRSRSDPDISIHKDKTEFADKRKSPNAALIGDSGLDLSATGAFSLMEAVKPALKGSNVYALDTRCSPVPEVPADIHKLGSTTCYPNLGLLSAITTKFNEMQGKSEISNIPQSLYGKTAKFTEIQGKSESLNIPQSTSSTNDVLTRDYPSNESARVVDNNSVSSEGGNSSLKVCMLGGHYSNLKTDSFSQKNSSNVTQERESVNLSQNKINSSSKCELDFNGTSRF